MKSTRVESKDVTRNGVNVTKLAATIRAIEKQPELAQFKFRARNQWDDGGHNVATVDTFYGTCQEMQHKAPLVMHADEPAVLLGEDQGANPVEFVLAGLSGCMTTTLAYHAAGRGLNLESIESEYDGDIAARQRDYDRAIASLGEAVRLEDGLAYIEPPDWGLPARHMLGAVLLEADRPGEAETVYWEDLRRNPESGWALFGLAQSLL